MTKCLKKHKQEQYCNKFNKDFKKGPHPKHLFEKKASELIGEGLDDLQRSMLTFIGETMA